MKAAITPAESTCRQRLDSRQTHLGRLSYLAGVALVLALMVLGVTLPGASLFAQDSFEFKQDYLPPTFAWQTVGPGLPSGFDQDSLLAKLQPESVEIKFLGSFVFGDENSRSIAVLIVQDQGQPVLYVDLNRDKLLALDERFGPSVERSWRTTLTSEFVRGKQREEVPVTIQLKASSDLQRVSLATVGTMNGNVKLDQNSVPVKYLDRNSNGRWFDPEDRVLLDINNDGQLDPLIERFPCDTLCRIGSQQYSMGGDPMGKRLSLKRLQGVGQIKPILQLVDEDAVVEDLEFVLASTTGIRVNGKSLDQPFDCPVGDYHLESLRFTLKEEKESLGFVFAARETSRTFIKVEAGQVKPMELIGTLQFTGIRSIVNDGHGRVLMIEPVLNTETGLYLIKGTKGQSASVMLENQLQATSRCRDQKIGLATSGFS